MRLCWGFQIQSGRPFQALHCLAAIIATGLLPALAIRPAKRSLQKEPSASIARVCDATLLLLLASHFLGAQRKNVNHQIIYWYFRLLPKKTF